MTAAVMAYARISQAGLTTHSAAGRKLVSWRELGAGEPDQFGLPHLRARYFSNEPSPRFGRMDMLCKLGLGVAELCMALVPTADRQDTALVGATMLGSIEVDAQYHDTLLKGGPAAASPGLFVYTLPSMFLGEIAIKFGIRGPTTLISAGKLSAIAALANGARLIEKRRAKEVLVVAAEAVGPAARALDLDSQGRSGAAAWFLGRAEGICTISGVRYGGADGEPLAPGEDGFGLTCLQALEECMSKSGTWRCGEGANAISLHVGL